MTRAQWAPAHFAAEVALLRYFASSPLAETGNGSVSWVVTGVASNTHNGVVHTRLAPERARAEIASTIQLFQARDLPATWFLGADSTPADLGRRLEAAGCRPERTAWVMGAFPSDLPRRPAPLPTGVMVVEVTETCQLDDWFEAARDVTFDDDAVSNARRRRLYASLDLGPNRPWRHWLATDAGRPVGTASALFDGDVVAVDNVGGRPEVPPARHRQCADPCPRHRRPRQGQHPVRARPVSRRSAAVQAPWLRAGPVARRPRVPPALLNSRQRTRQPTWQTRGPFSDYPSSLTRPGGGDQERRRIYSERSIRAMSLFGKNIPSIWR